MLNRPKQDAQLSNWIICDTDVPLETRQFEVCKVQTVVPSTEKPFQIFVIITIPRATYFKGYQYSVSSSHNPMLIL